MEQIKLSYSGSDNECNVVAPAPKAVVFDPARSLIKWINREPHVPVYSLPSDLKHCGCEVNRTFSSYAEVYRFVSQNLKDIADSAKCQNQVRVFLSIKCEAPLVPREALVSAPPPPLPVPLPSGGDSYVDYAPASDQVAHHGGSALPSTADIPMPLAPPVVDPVPSALPPVQLPAPLPTGREQYVPDHEAEGSGSEVSDVSVLHYLDPKVVAAFDKAHAQVDPERIVPDVPPPPPPPAPEKPARVKQEPNKRKRLSSQDRFDKALEEERLEDEGWGTADKPRKLLDESELEAFADELEDFLHDPNLATYVSPFERHYTLMAKDLRFEDIPISELGMRLERRQRILKHASSDKRTPVRTNYLVKEMVTGSKWLVKRYAIQDGGKKNPAKHECQVGSELEWRYRNVEYLHSLSEERQALLKDISRDGYKSPVLPQRGYFSMGEKASGFEEWARGYCFGNFVKLYSLPDLKSEHSKDRLPKRLETLKGCRDLLSLWAVFDIFQHGDLNENQIYWLPEERRFALGDFSHSILKVNDAKFLRSPLQPTVRGATDESNLLELFAEHGSLPKRDKEQLRSMAKQAPQWVLEEGGTWFGLKLLDQYIKAQKPGEHADNNSQPSQ